MRVISDGEGQSLKGGTLEIEAGMDEGLLAGVWGGHRWPEKCRNMTISHGQWHSRWLLSPGRNGHRGLTSILSTLSALL